MKIFHILLQLYLFITLIQINLFYKASIFTNLKLK
jgi:hypothetical protein